MTRNICKHLSQGLKMILIDCTVHCSEDLQLLGHREVSFQTYSG